MSLIKRLTAALLLRRVSRDLRALVVAVETQNTLLARLADQYAPLPHPVPSRAQLSSDTGVTHLDPLEAALAEGYVARTLQDTGHLPDDEEILIHLADEKTTDLHQRLTARDQELTRLMESRR